MVRKSATLVVILLVVAALVACQPRAVKPATGAPAKGGAAGATPPEGFSLADASTFKVDNYKGKVLVMDFWATWCGPCKMEIPHLIELQKEFRDQGLVVVGITMDSTPDKDVPPYAASVGMNYANIKGTEELKAEYGVVGLPTIVIYDRAGNQVLKRSGYIEKDQLREIITPLLTPVSS